MPIENTETKRSKLATDWGKFELAYMSQTEIKDAHEFFKVYHHIPKPKKLSGSTQVRLNVIQSNRSNIGSNLTAGITEKIVENISQEMTPYVQTELKHLIDAKFKGYQSLVIFLDVALQHMEKHKNNPKRLLDVNIHKLISVINQLKVELNEPTSVTKNQHAHTLYKPDESSVMDISKRLKEAEDFI